MKSKTIKDLIELYEASPDWSILSDNSKKSYKLNNKKLINKFGDFTIHPDSSQEARKQASTIFTELEEICPSNVARNAMRVHINMLWKWGVVNLDMKPDYNPVITMPRLRHEVKESNPFTKLEIQMVDGLLKEKNYKNQSILTEYETLVCWLVKFLFHTGMRPSEAINLSQNDVVQDEGDMLLQIVGAKGREEGKVSRYVFVNQEVAKCLAFASRFRDSRKQLDCDNIWVTVSGKRLDRNNMIKPFKSIMDKLGLKNKQFYDLRRGAATAIIHDPRYGVVVAQKQLGHKSINTTMRYENLNKKSAAKLFKGY